jgi:hypothetical protein
MDLQPFLFIACLSPFIGFFPFIVYFFLIDSFGLDKLLIRYNFDQ